MDRWIPLNLANRVAGETLDDHWSDHVSLLQCQLIANSQEHQHVVALTNPSGVYSASSQA